MSDFNLEMEDEKQELPLMRKRIPLRDWFAGQAMGIDSSNDILLVARMAYQMADAMMEAREE